MSIEAGQGLILKKGKNLKYVHVSNNKVEKLENFLFSCTDMIGKPYGTAFKVIDKQKLEVIDPVLVEIHCEEYDVEEGKKIEETKDNRAIHDHSDSQKLTKDEIMSLREDGKTGEEIVKELVDNSATFKDKSEFSKAKYLKKKKKKYLQHFVALKPTARLLAEMYFFKNPAKILEIRPDGLAQILTWSNCQSNSKVLLVDTCQGFVAGAVLERLGLDGKLVQLYQGSFPVRIILEQFNFSLQDVQTKVSSFPLEKIADLQRMFEMEEKNEDLIETIFGKNKEDHETKEVNDKVEGKDEGEPCKEETQETTEISDKVEIKVEAMQLETPLPIESINEKTNDAEVEPVEIKKDGGKNIDNNRKRRRDRDYTDAYQRNAKRVAFLTKDQRIVECLKAMVHLRSKDFDSLIIVAKYHPKNLLLALLEYVPCACPFVVYFTHQEPLMDCYVTLRERNLASNLELTESWLRNIQVLPKRTHPEIVMSATGGFMLRGVKVKN